jgi:WD40 repeat protein
MAKVFTWDTGNSVGEMVGHVKRVLSVAYKPSRPFRIMTASEDSKTIYYAGPPFKLDHSNAVHTNFVNCVRYSNNGENLISVGSDKKIQLYDGKTGQPTTEINNGHEGSVYSVSFSPDGTKFITCSADKTVRLWDYATQANEQTFTTGADPQVGDMQVSVLWTQSHMLSVSLNGNVNYWEAGSVAPVRIVQGHQVAIMTLALDAQNRMVYTGSFDGVVCATPLDTCVPLRMIGTDKRSVCGASHGGKVVGMALHNNQILSIGWDDCIRVGDLATNSYVADVSTNGQPRGIASHPASNLYAVVTTSEIAMYEGFNKVFSMQPAYTPTCVALVDNEVAVGGSDFKTHVYSIAGGSFTEITAIETRSEVSAVSYSPVGDALAIGDNGRQVEVFERGTWAPRVKGRWVFHTSKVTCLSWSPSGAFLASGSQDENIFIWCFEKPTTKKQISFAHAGGVSGLAWVDEERLVSAGNDHCIVTWKVPVE